MKIEKPTSTPPSIEKIGFSVLLNFSMTLTHSTLPLNTFKTMLYLINSKKILLTLIAYLKRDDESLNFLYAFQKI